MKKITFLTLMASLLLFTACGDDKNSVTTQDLDCTANSIYEDGTWYLSATDKRECDATANNPYNDLSCPSGQTAVRITNSSANNTLGSNSLSSRNVTRNTHTSNVSGIFGWEVSSSFCVSIFGSQPCPQTPTGNINARDYNRYDVDREIYDSNNNIRYDGNYRVACVNDNDSNIFTVGGVLYYEYVNHNSSTLSADEALTAFFVGVLVGAVLAN